ncbi:MAG TPA: sulfur carrier protein ThiS [Thermoanaerobaculia bacterium]|nr:sulfur carrier protein ThiS [Thermoanaerobaculia bacterium]
MKAKINGQVTDLEREMTIAEFLRAKGLPERLVAVEVNGRWLKREEWDAALLKANDEVEVVRMFAGG